MIAILFGAVLPWLLTALSAAVSSDVWKDTVPGNSRRAFLLTNRALVRSGFLTVSRTRTQQHLTPLAFTPIANEKLLRRGFLSGRSAGYSCPSTRQLVFSLLGLNTA